MNRFTLVHDLLKLKTAEADHAVYLLSMADDVFSKIHAELHAYAVRDGYVCGCDMMLPAPSTTVTK